MFWSRHFTSTLARWFAKRRSQAWSRKLRTFNTEWKKWRSRLQRQSKSYLISLNSYKRQLRLTRTLLAKQIRLRSAADEYSHLIPSLWTIVANCRLSWATSIRKFAIATRVPRVWAGRFRSCGKTWLAKLVWINFGRVVSIRTNSLSSTWAPSTLKERCKSLSPPWIATKRHLQSSAPSTSRIWRQFGALTRCLPSRQARYIWISLRRNCLSPLQKPLWSNR